MKFGKLICILGTELYHSFEHLSKLDLKDVSVLEDGVKFGFLEKWDISQTQEYKTRKFSINEFSDGIELCWGIGEYGYHIYKLNYTIENFLNDQNEIDFKILEFKTPKPEKTTVKVIGDFDKNAFAKIKNSQGFCVVKDSEVIYTIENFNDFVTIYLNYDGQDNSVENNEIVKIKYNEKYQILEFIKKIILFLILVFSIIILMIIYINSKKVQKVEFKPF